MKSQPKSTLHTPGLHETSTNSELQGLSILQHPEPTTKRGTNVKSENAGVLAWIVCSIFNHHQVYQSKILLLLTFTHNFKSTEPKQAPSPMQSSSLHLTTTAVNDGPFHSIVWPPLTSQLQASQTCAALSIQKTYGQQTEYNYHTHYIIYLARIEQLDNRYSGSMPSLQQSVDVWSTTAHHNYKTYSRIHFSSINLQHSHCVNLYSEENMERSPLHVAVHLFRVLRMRHSRTHQCWSIRIGEVLEISQKSLLIKINCRHNRSTYEISALEWTLPHHFYNMIMASVTWRHSSTSQSITSELL